MRIVVSRWALLFILIATFSVRADGTITIDPTQWVLANKSILVDTTTSPVTFFGNTYIYSPLGYESGNFVLDLAIETGLGAPYTPTFSPAGISVSLPPFYTFRSGNVFRMVFSFDEEATYPGQFFLQFSSSAPADLSCQVLYPGGNRGVPTGGGAGSLITISADLKGAELNCFNNSSTAINTILIRSLTVVPGPAPSPSPSPTPIASYTLSLNLSHSEVFPNHTGGDPTTLVTARLASTSPDKPVSGMLIQFSSVAEPDSGGHLHTEGRPGGIFDALSCITGNDGTCAVFYAASDFGGIENISAAVSNAPTVKASAVLTVRVPGLIELGPSNFYRLTGDTDAHRKNHFAAEKALSGAFDIAFDFFEAFGKTLGINDMSLPSGGLFDIGPPKYFFWQTSHVLHRVGKSVDIDRCVEADASDDLTLEEPCPNGAVGWIRAPRDWLIAKCNEYDGNIINESTIHCEF